MNIAEKFTRAKVEPTKDELYFLLWSSLIELSSYADKVTIVEEESFEIEEMLNNLDHELGITP